MIAQEFREKDIRERTDERSGPEFRMKNISAIFSWLQYAQGGSIPFSILDKLGEVRRGEFRCRGGRGRGSSAQRGSIYASKAQQ